MKIPELPMRKEISHKGDFGRLLIIAGSRGMIGAGCLTTMAALRSGCGLVHLAIPETSQKIAAAKIIGALTIPLSETKSGSIAKEAKKQIIDNLGNKDSVAIGPGLTTDAETVDLICDLLENEINVPTVVDADAINAISHNIQVLDYASKRFSMIITPHPGEMARLLQCSTSDIQADRTKAAHEFAAKYPDVTLVLKGHQTIVRKNNREYVNSTGNAGLAKGGTGDVLTGMIAGLLAQKMSDFDAAVLGVYLHGLSADFASEVFTQYCMTAEDLLNFLPKAFKTRLNN